MSDNELIQKAIEMRSKALAPYSSYKVGAAVLTESGKFLVAVTLKIVVIV